MSIYIFFFSSSSIIHKKELELRITNLEEVLSKLQYENELLRKKLNKLKDPEYLRSYLAKYGYAKNNEIIVDFILPEIERTNETGIDEASLLKPYKSLQWGVFIVFLLLFICFGLYVYFKEIRMHTKKDDKKNEKSIFISNEPQ
ncbi:septum formation initiator family protein [Spirochaetota bacterium]